MKIFPSKTTPIITLVACVHGDESFGLTLVDYFVDKLDQYPGLQLLVANEEAIAQNKRFIDSDLNRSYPGKVDGDKEQRLACEILEAIKTSEYILDIHNTTSDILMTPIVTMMTEKTKEIINLCDSREVAFIQKPLADKALFGHTDGAVSLEFSFGYSDEHTAIDQVIRIVEGLLFNKPCSRVERDIFFVDGVISKETRVPSVVENFRYIDSLQVYPFLVGERAYKDIHAMSASKKETEII